MALSGWLFMNLSGFAFWVVICGSFWFRFVGGNSGSDDEMYGNVEPSLDDPPFVEETHEAPTASAARRQGNLPHGGPPQIQSHGSPPRRQRSRSRAKGDSSHTDHLQSTQTCRSVARETHMSEAIVPISPSESFEWKPPPPEESPLAAAQNWAHQEAEREERLREWREAGD